MIPEAITRGPFPDRSPHGDIGRTGSPDAYLIDPGAGSGSDRVSRFWPQRDMLDDIHRRGGEITPLYAHRRLTSHSAGEGLREALKPFARVADELDRVRKICPLPPGAELLDETAVIPTKLCYAARDALLIPSTDVGYDPTAPVGRINITPEHDAALHRALLASTETVEVLTPPSDAGSTTREEQLRSILKHRPGCTVDQRVTEITALFAGAVK